MQIGTVCFTRGGELMRDGLSADALVASAPTGLRELVERCAGRVVLVENRDGLPPASDELAHWAARRKRGAELLASVLPGGCAPHPVGMSALEPSALRAMPAASALSAASALQGAVGDKAASDVTDESLGVAFSAMLEQMRARAGGKSALADSLGALQPPTPGGPLELELSAALPENMSVPDGATPPPAGSKLWLSQPHGSTASPRLLISGTVRFVTPTLLWAGGAVSRGTHRLKLHGPTVLKGSVRLRSPPGLTLVVRGPLSLSGPLTARVGPAPGASTADQWLAEGVLRCGLAPVEVRTEGVSAHSGDGTDAVQCAFCELHGAEAAEEVKRAAGEASSLELSEGAKLEIKEGAALWIDGSAGMGPALGSASGSTLVAAHGRLEVFGLAELLLTGPTALMPTPPRVLAQVVHTG